MNKLILPILLIIGVLVVSGCTQSGDTTQPINDTQKTGQQDGDQATTRDDIGIIIPDYEETNPKQAWETFKEKYGLPGDMKSGGAGILWDEERGIPKYIVGFRSSHYDGSPQEVATLFLQEHGNLIAIQNNSLFFIETYKSGEENRVVYEQRHQNIPVFGTNVQILVTSDNRVRQVSLDYYPDISLIKDYKGSAEISDFKAAVRSFLIGEGFKEGPELDNIIETREPEKFIYPLIEGDSVKFYSTLLYRLPMSRLVLDVETTEVVNIERLY